MSHKLSSRQPLFVYLILLIIVPAAYGIVLWVQASQFSKFYKTAVSQVPFAFISIAVALVLTLIPPLIMLYIFYFDLQKQEYAITSVVQQQENMINSMVQQQGDTINSIVKQHEEKIGSMAHQYENEINAIVQQREDTINSLLPNHRHLAHEVLVNGTLVNMFNSDLYPGLQKNGNITQVEELSGGYSGAKIYLVYRNHNDIPDVLKIDDIREIENEEKKFFPHVDHKIAIAPNVCNKYDWGKYGGLEYNLEFKDLGRSLTFLQLYQACLHERPILPKQDEEKNLSKNKEIYLPPKIKTIENILTNEPYIIFQIIKSWKWKKELRVEGGNLFEEYYPCMRHRKEIYDGVEPHFSWGKDNLPNWNAYQKAIVTLLTLREWNKWRKTNQKVLIARATIHGDLNARNILLEFDPKDHTVYTVGLVDFSHTGNGLKRKWSDKYIEEKIKIDRDRANVANDFCRLEADIKFYLTDLENEQEVRQAWLLECLMLEQNLELASWNEIDLVGLLEKKNLIDDPLWADLAHLKNYSRKFELMWRSVRAIRKQLADVVNIKEYDNVIKSFYMALLQVSLPLIYYEDERFYNATLQKRYLVLSAGLLSKKIIEAHPVKS